jgi:uncharacterized protein (DUF1800 family)
MSMNTNETYLDAAHLLRRAGFGGAPDEIAAAAQRGLAETTSNLLEIDGAPDPIDDGAVMDKLKSALPDTARELAQLRLPILLVQVWWIYRMLATSRPLQEKMVLFWHNHFTSSDTNGSLMMEQNQLYRRMALGNFRTLALAVSKNPEMLQYLNNAQNYKAHPNENYARELMELFTCGRVGPDGKPNYTEDDVKASARAFSGWNSRRQAFYFNPNQHDDTDKTFMGRTGDLNGDDIVDILVAMPQTAYAICRKLFRAFAYDEPEADVMDALVDTYFRTGYEIRPIVEQILTSNAFYSAKARGAIIKSPAEYVVGSVRTLGLSPSFAPAPEYLFGDDPNTPPPVLPVGRQFQAYTGPRRGGLASPVGRIVFLNNQMRNMGQVLFGPPTVKGWDGGTMWINTDTLQSRARFAAALASLPDLQIDGIDAQFQPFARPAAFGQTAPGSARGEAERIVDAVLRQLGPLDLPNESRQALLDYAAQEPNPYQCLRGIVTLAMGTPEYQVS